MVTIKYVFRWFWLISIVTILSLVFTSIPVIAGNGYRYEGSGRGGGGGDGYGGGGDGGSLTQEEIYWLTHMREEEKLARDVYRVMYSKWGAYIFSNIAASEQRHTDVIENLIDKYGIPDPVANENILGNFTDPNFNTLYNKLVARGLSSLDEAYRVGVDIEILDIGDLINAIEASSRTDIDNVFSNLLNGSYNHLAVFDSKLN